ncbi:DUF951 domain-containing protein [Anaeromicrobium sediminis]|nr:DUF951 domain-containing protein [Anaeromicrobium sediminis]
MAMQLYVGDIIQVKKQHPCGSSEFEIMRTGMDFRIKCLGCGKQIWIDRPKLEKRIKTIVKREEVQE